MLGGVVKMPFIDDELKSGKQIRDIGHIPLDDHDLDERRKMRDALEEAERTELWDFKQNQNSLLMKIAFGVLLYVLA